MNTFNITAENMKLRDQLSQLTKKQLNILAGDDIADYLGHNWTKEDGISSAFYYFVHDDNRNRDFEHMARNLARVIEGTYEQTNYGYIITNGTKTFNYVTTRVNHCHPDYSMAFIAEQAQAVFDDLYNVHDILNGNSIEMHQEARLIAIRMLNKKGL